MEERGKGSSEHRDSRNRVCLQENVEYACRCRNRVRQLGRDGQKLCAGPKDGIPERRDLRAELTALEHKNEQAGQGVEGHSRNAEEYEPRAKVFMCRSGRARDLHRLATRGSDRSRHVASIPIGAVVQLASRLGIIDHGKRELPRCFRLGRGILQPMPYVPAADRYGAMPYRRCGRSGLKLPAVSLGLWQNFGGDRPIETSRAILRRAFDRGITHFDLANNYGPPYGSAETNFGRIFADDFRPYRDELVISTKAGYDMWPGPYGDRGSRKYLLASLDQSLQRMGLDYVDIFYSHRADPDTPLAETLGALDTAVRQGKALYAGVSSYSARRTEEAVRILRELGTPLLIHQPSYSMLNRWIEGGLLAVLEREGVGCIVFSPLAQGMLTDKYLHGVPEDSRAARGDSFSPELLTDENLERIRALNEIAARRGQSLAQLALAWTLREPRVTSTLIGASSVERRDTLGQPVLAEHVVGIQ